MRLNHVIPCLIFLIPLSQLMGQWTPIGLESEGISSIVIDLHNPNVIYASAIFPADSEGVSGIFKSIDGGITWDTIYHGWDMHLTIHPDSSNILYATEWATPVIKTTDGGTTWFKSDSGITIGVECVGGGNICISPQNPLIMYAGTSCIGGGPMYRSTDGGKFWTIIYEPAVVIGIDPDSSQRAYMGTSWDCYVYRSTDEGYSWISSGFRSGGPGGFAFGRPSSTIYLASSHSNSFPKGIFKSTDAGITWSNIINEIPGNYCNATCIVNRRNNNPDDIFIGTNIWSVDGSDSGQTFGVYRSTDGGDSWFNFGLDSIRVHVLGISPDENTLYAGVLFPDYGRRAGIYKRDLVTHVRESGGKVHEFMLGQNYPNPWNPSTKLSFVIGHSSFVTLKVYDVLGQEIAVLVNERKQPGEHKVTWNAEGVPSGVYFYRLVAGEFVDTKKMVLVK